MPADLGPKSGAWLGTEISGVEPMQICRILNGMWQVSGAHGPIDPQKAVDRMLEHHRCGLTTWDLADHYGPAEDFIGSFRKELESASGSDALQDILAFTKWVPPPAAMPRSLVEQNIDRSLRRMGVDRLDMLQFHWWDYGDDAYLDAMGHMADLQSEGKIRTLALTNFDTEHTRIIHERTPVVSNQVQYSLVDLRPEREMVSYCLSQSIGLLAYGVLCGGLMSEKWLGRPEPSRAELNTASLGKYNQMIGLWGGWDLFQELLGALKAVADKHSVSIANVATAAILDKPAVAGVIIGVRLGLSDNLQDNLRVFDVELDDEDRSLIQSVTGKSRDLFSRIGDCGDEYRRR